MITISKIIAKIKAETVYRMQFRKYGRHTLIYSPIAVEGKENIEIGSHVTVGTGGWIAARNLTGNDPKLTIGEGTSIGNYSHIYCTKKIDIGNYVLIADKVYITDNLHDYENIDIPIISSGIKQIGEVEIGEGSWIGEGVCVIGAKIGRHCVVGANAVVTKDIPDNTVAVGVPAKVIKKWDEESKTWKSI